MEVHENEWQIENKENELENAHSSHMENREEPARYQFDSEVEVPEGSEELLGSSLVVKRECRKSINKVARGVLFYNIIMLVVVVGDMLIRTLQIMITSTSGEQTDKLLNELVAKMEKSGTSSIVAITIGVLFLYFYFRKQEYGKKLFADTGRKMTWKRFLMLIPILMSAQIIFSIIGAGVEAGLNYFGYSILGEMESASSSSTTISMFLYASVLGPITEEIVFRGFVLRGLQKYGKPFAIIASAIIFGAFHGNLIQGIFAAFVGLVLGYVAMEYSIKWSIVLHIVNNFVFGDLLTYLMTGISEVSQNILLNIMDSVFFIGAIVILIYHRNKIKDYIVNNKSRKGIYAYAFTRFWMVLFLVLQILLGVLGIEKM